MPTAKKPVKTPAKRVVARKTTVAKVVKEDYWEDERYATNTGGLRYEKADWYVPSKDGDGFLAGIRCSMCKKGFKAGQSVWAFSTSLRANYYGTRTRSIVALHAVCMRAKLERAPAEKYDEIRERIANGGGLFD